MIYVWYIYIYIRNLSYHWKMCIEIQHRTWIQPRSHAGSWCHFFLWWQYHPFSSETSPRDSNNSSSQVWDDMFVGLPSISNKNSCSVVWSSNDHINLESTKLLSISYWIKFEVHWTWYIVIDSGRIDKQSWRINS